MEVVELTTGTSEIMSLDLDRLMALEAMRTKEVLIRNQVQGTIMCL